mgnify:CR=1 FL=1
MPMPCWRESLLDTKNFVMRTGVRTFEAAAYLRKIAIDGISFR